MSKVYRTNIMSVATKLFAERGLNGVSIRELSATAEVSISMISYHFGGKEGLYSSVLQEQFACFEQVEEIRNADQQPIEKIEACIRWIIRRHREHPHLLRFYASELTNPTQFFPTIVLPAIKKVIEALVEFINLGIDRRQFRASLSDIDTVVAIVGMVIYYFLSTLATKELVDLSPERDEELVRHYMDLLTKGILVS